LYTYNYSYGWQVVASNSTGAFTGLSAYSYPTTSGQYYVNVTSGNCNGSYGYVYINNGINLTVDSIKHPSCLDDGIFNVHASGDTGTYTYNLYGYYHGLVAT